MPSRLRSRHERAAEPRERASRAPVEDPDRGLVVKSVSKSWIDQDRTALQDVDIAVGRGATAAIVGANGSGKTTMLRVIAGLVKPDEGSVSLDGLDPERDGRRYRSRIGFLTAGNSGLFARLSVKRHLDYSARLALLGRGEARDAVERTLDGFALREFASRRVDRLSLGQRQRVRAALAFLHRPQLVLLDEPHNSLDERALALLHEAVADLTARGGIAVWCAPALGEREGQVDRTFVMRDGRLARA